MHNYTIHTYLWLASALVWCDAYNCDVVWCEQLVIRAVHSVWSMEKSKTGSCRRLRLSPRRNPPGCRHVTNSMPDSISRTDGHGAPSTRRHLSGSKSILVSSPRYTLDYVVHDMNERSFRCFTWNANRMCDNFDHCTGVSCDRTRIVSDVTIIGLTLLDVMSCIRNRWHHFECKMKTVIAQKVRRNYVNLTRWNNCNFIGLHVS